ncbi:hypothetical protein OPV22_034571 [Ensete ventricosum]|uniref:Transmembrane 9 superfamily member n=1 Tax=Ensete ventricosum TaxID=4639 RepID=A0AAV8PUY2_ENSVE|nr:hypothetical protein OPV22_034571 [Ensete ventricosum]
MGVISETEMKKMSGYEIVGFEVVPCSVKRDTAAISKLSMYDEVDPVDCPLELDEFQTIQEQEKISFTYEVVFVKSDVRWPRRWDAYLRMQDDKLSGWKVVVGDFFREPTYSKLSCVMVGDGVQITVPLMLLGGFLGTRADHIQYPVRTNQIPREIPSRKYPSWLLVLGAGTLPFGTLFIELFFILSSIWLGRFCYMFGFLLIGLLLLVIICSEVSVILTSMHLCVEDWQWWWKAFFVSGSVAVYVFQYSINYLVFQLRTLSVPVSVMLYLGYSLIMALALMLSTGTISFLISFYFVHYLFSSVKID